eukprot:gene2099-2133_t
MPYCAILWRSFSWPASDSATSSRAPSSPTRSISAGMPCGKPGEAKPPLRPEAPQPTRFASRTTTSFPRSARSSAVARPARPAPMTQISVSIVPLAGSASNASPSVCA